MTWNIFAPRAPLESTMQREAPAPREAITQVSDYLCTATADANGKRLREREVRGAIKLLDRL